MISDSEGDDFEDASEFGVDDSEMFGMGSSSCRKSPMSEWTVKLLQKEGEMYDFNSKK